MKELSFLMFLVALLFGISVIVRSIMYGKHPDSSYFYIPSQGMFNIIWGSIFYIGYGMLMYPETWVSYVLGVGNGLLLFYAYFLLRVKKFLLSPEKKGAEYIRKYLLKQLDKEQGREKKGEGYSYKKCLKILGLPPYCEVDSQEFATRFEQLTRVEESGKLPHPYLKEIIKKIAEARRKDSV